MGSRCLIFFLSLLTYSLQHLQRLNRYKLKLLTRRNETKRKEKKTSYRKKNK